MNFAIKCQGVVKRYPHFTLDHVDLMVEEGSVMGFVGPNGAGKSTTMRILMGLVCQDEGAVDVLGHSMPAEQIAAKRDIGFISEDMRLFESETIGFHMNFFKSVYPSWDDGYADDLLKRFGLIRGQKTKGLSHGQRVKTLLLLVLARRPRLLVLDEPTTGLDPVARREILDQLMHIIEDETRTILFSSHNTLDVEQISDSISFILNGRIIDSKDKETFLDSWRRIRLQVPEDFRLPQHDGVIDIKHSGSLAVLTTRDFTEEMIADLKSDGSSVQAVERMTLEEIFVANAQQARNEVAS